MKLMTTVAIICAFIISFTVNASEWQIDPEQSRLNFISIKKMNVAETHEFKNFSGDIDQTGHVEISIDLASVETAVPIRNERMATFLFETNLFPKATLSAKLDNEFIDTLKEGESKLIELDTILDLHGSKDDISIKMIVAKLSDNKMLVVSASPIIIEADDFELSAGVEKLREIAKLPSISHAVPVTFALTLQRNN